MVDESLNEIYLVPKAIYSDRHKVNWKIQPGSTIAAYVAYKKEYVLLEDIFNDDRFPNGLGYFPLHYLQSVTHHFVASTTTWPNQS